MSGIAGLWSIAPGAVDPARVRTLAGALAQRGPDRTAFWFGDGIALAHCLLATTPEAVHEPQPFVDQASGQVIVADARIDNRAELLPLLAAERDPASVGDAELILRGYQAWGPACARRLIGDFAFAIHDPPGDRLFCARDPIGLRQLIYAWRPGRLFAFATDADPLAGLAEVGARLNQERVADFLASLEGSGFEATFYRDIVRLPPAHTLTVTRGELALDRYWEPRPGPPLRLSSDQAYADAFMAVFTEAVHCRLRRNGDVGAMLSGGTDSSAIAAVASTLMREDGTTLQTFSAVGPDPSQCTETRLIRQSADHLRSEATFVDHAALDERDSGELALGGADSLEPFDSTSMLTRSVYRAAHLKGVRIVLDGAAADTILASGNRVAALLAGGRFVAAWREAGAHAAFLGKPGLHFSMVAKAAWVVVMPRWLRRLARAVRGSLLDRSPAAALGRLRPDFVRRSALATRRKAYRDRLETARPFGADYLARVLAHPNLAVARERYDRIASRFAIEPRDPFTDIRLIEFCLTLPPSQFQDRGLPKIVLRRAIDGLVPPEVAWRGGKSHLGPEFVDAVAGRDAFAGDTPDVPESLRPYVRAARDDPDLPPGWFRHEWRALAQWLERRGFGVRTEAPPPREGRGPPSTRGRRPRRSRRR